jgi:hypothetical protein
MQIGSSTSFTSAASLLAANEVNTQAISQLSSLSRGSDNARQSQSSSDTQALAQTQNAPTANGQRGSLLNILV